MGRMIGNPYFARLLHNKLHGYADIGGLAYKMLTLLFCGPGTWKKKTFSRPMARPDLNILNGFNINLFQFQMIACCVKVLERPICKKWSAVEFGGFSAKLSSMWTGKFLESDCGIYDLSSAMLALFDLGQRTTVHKCTYCNGLHGSHKISMLVQMLNPPTELSLSLF